MSATNKDLPKNTSLEYLPASFDVTADAWLPNTGTGGAPDVRIANDGTDQTGVTPPTGATGIRGWLSALYALFLSAIGLTNATAPAKALLIGGKDVSGNMHALQLDANKNQKVSPTNSAGNPIENTEGTLLASAARTASPPSAVQRNYSARGVTLFLNVTANPGGAETLTIVLYLRDGTAGVVTWDTQTLVIPAATNGLFALQVYPGATAAMNNATRHKTVSLAIPPSWAAGVLHSGGGSWTYSLNYGYTI